MLLFNKNKLDKLAKKQNKTKNFHCRMFHMVQECKVGRILVEQLYLFSCIDQ